MELIEKYFPEISDLQRERFAALYDLYADWNAKINVVSRKDFDQLYLRHVLHSLAIAKVCAFDAGARILDVGCGGGFPSVPLKINNESLTFTLIEATGKKCAFLRAAGEKLNFNNFFVLQGRAEVLAKSENYREKFDIVTARAVARLNELLEFTVPFLKVGGKLVLYKNYSLSEINEAKTALKTLNCEITDIKKYVLNGDEKENAENNIVGEKDENKNERAVIIIKKKEKTPEKYPREYKQIIKKPL